MSQASKGDESKSADKKLFDHMLKEALERGQDGQDLQLDSGQSIESERDSLDLRPWSVWRAALLLLPLYRCVAQARCQPRLVT